MDSVANSIVDLIFNVDRLPPAINIVHSHPVNWSAVIQDVADAMVQELHLPTPLRLVSFQEWFSLLEKHGSSSDEAKQVKIVSRFAWRMIRLLTLLDTAGLEIAGFLQGSGPS
jgi:hypothetical protein